MKKKSIIISLIFAFNALILFLNQIAMTRIFGAKLDLEIFLAAAALPALIISALYASLNDAFLPLYGQKKAKNKQKADVFFLSSLLTMVTTFFLISFLMMALSPFLAHLMYQARGENFVQNTAFQMRYLFLALPLAAIASLFGSFDYAHKKFLRFPIAQLSGNLLILLMTIFTTRFFGIWAMVASFVLSIGLQALITFPKEFKKITVNFQDQKRFFLAFLPLVSAFFLFRSENVIIRSLASFLPQGYFVYLNLISKFFALATGITTIGIQILLLPHLVDFFNNPSQIEKGIKLVKKAKIISLLATLFISLTVFLVTPFIIHLLFIGGKFSYHDAQLAISVLPLFILPAIGWGSYPVFFQPLIALHKQNQIAMIAFLSLTVSLTTAYITKIAFGPLTAISLSLTALLLTGIILSEILWQKEKKILLKKQKL